MQPLSSLQPHQYQRRILLVVTGLTPQIVTETLYGLTIDQPHPFIPTEIHFITTADGADSAKAALLGVGNHTGWIQRFCNEYGLKDIHCNDQHIHIISDTEGEFVSNEESTRHNQIASDFITDKVRQFTEDHDCALHLSLAGGRKTMSYYAGYALSLYGRQQDRLSHVLVNTPFQTNEQFFYKPLIPERIEVNGQFHSTNDAKIILSMIPFVRMRDYVPRLLLSGKAGFQETIHAIQHAFEPPEIIINLRKHHVLLGGIQVSLDAAELALYLLFCERKSSKKPPLFINQPEFDTDYLQTYKRLVSEFSGLYDRAENVSENKNYNKMFIYTKSRIHKKIKQAQTLGENAAQPYYIHTVDIKGKAAYEISVPASHIKINYQ